MGHSRNEIMVEPDKTREGALSNQDTTPQTFSQIPLLKRKLLNEVHAGLASDQI